VAAPAGLAATVTGAALAGTSTAAALTFMSLTKLQLGLAGAILVGGAGVFAVQEQNNAALRAELAGMPPSRGEIAGLRQTNLELERTARRVADLQVSDAELARLRDEVTARQQRVQALARPAVQPSPKPSSRAPAAETFDITDLDEKPKATAQQAPDYPANLGAAGIEGSVIVEFGIDANGKVYGARAVESSQPEFEAAAVAAVEKWQFDPGRKGGRLVNTRAQQRLDFKLAGKSDTAHAPANWF
jgi:TonB family protein